MAIINENFMLSTDTARTLYKEYAENAPIIDFHNHLDARLIATNYTARSITELWLGSDHYKWRAMRANGIDEHYITGAASDFEKFEKWASTVPHTMRNPLYHWNALELKYYFDIDEPLDSKSAKSIYERCNAKISEGGFGAADLLLKMGVEVVCTTDDPTDTLEYHGVHHGIKVVPTWRPDRLMAIECSSTFNEYIDRFGASISTLEEFLIAINKRQAHFISKGCRASDHGLDTFYALDCSEVEASEIFTIVREGNELNQEQISMWKSFMLNHLAELNYKADWVQQFHVGPLRNNCSRLFKSFGADAGCDSIDDKPLADSMSKFLNRLDSNNKLTRTIVYNLNPKDSETIASMLYNFNDGSEAGKMQYGAAWWFLDQIDGMKKQIETLSSLGLLSHFVGMLTDSRSFLSFTRHQYFRRLLCDILGSDLENGLIENEQFEFVGDMVSRICYGNSKRYFKF